MERGLAQSEQDGSGPVSSPLDKLTRVGNDVSGGGESWSVTAMTRSAGGRASTSQLISPEPAVAGALLM